MRADLGDAAFQVGRADFENVVAGLTADAALKVTPI
jgi:hypothetical protein